LRRVKRNFGNNLISQRRRLSSDARIIIALLNKQPQKLDELCKNAGVHQSTFYRICPLLEARGIIKKTMEGYALWTYKELEKIAIEAVNRWKSLAFRYPTLNEVADEIGVDLEGAAALIHRTKNETGWFAPNQGIIEGAREKLGEVLICASRIKEGIVSNFNYENDQEILKEAERFIKKHPKMLPKLSERGDVSYWPPEALKYLGANYKPKNRRIPTGAIVG